MKKGYVPLTIELIDEGRFLADMNADFLRLQEKMIDFCHEHKEEATGAKGEMLVKLTLKAEKPQFEIFSIKGATRTALPGRPAVTSSAQGDTEDSTGMPLLAVRPLGSSKEPPAQGKLYTDDGRMPAPAPTPEQPPAVGA